MLQPFPGPLLKQLPQFGGEQEERLLWGTYRPGYYFGALLCLAGSRARWHRGSMLLVRGRGVCAGLPRFSGCAPRTHDQPAVAPRRGAGMRMRRPQSLVAGVMWMDPHRWDPLRNIRWGRRGGPARHCVGAALQGALLPDA